jgi:hypothetical protein
MAVQYHNNYIDTTNFSDTSYRMTLTTGVEVTVTVPGDAEDNLQAIFGYAATSQIMVGYNSSPTIPANDTAVSTGRVEVNPIKRFVKGGDVLHFMTPDTSALVGVSLRALP